MSGISASRHGDQLVALKQADEPDHRARLRHEATVLAELDHPGVVHLVDFDEGPPAALRTSFVGPDSWAHRPPVGDARFDGLAAVIATVADLHDAGVTHGSLRAAHIVIGPDKRPILCGLGDADRAQPETIAVDRHDLAALARTLDTDEPLLAEAATDLDDPSLPLRDVVRRLDTRSTVPSRPTRRLPLPSFGRRHAAIAAITGGTALLAGLASIAVLRTSEPAQPATAVPAAAVAPLERPAATTTIATQPVPPDAPVVEFDGRRYALGAPGDLVTVGDWDCNGTETPAVLRPSTGAVAVFSSWPANESQIVADVTTTVDGAVDFVPTDQPCPDLRVRTRTGSRIIDLPEN